MKHRLSMSSSPPSETISNLSELVPLCDLLVLQMLRDVSFASIELSPQLRRAKHALFVACRYFVLLIRCQRVAYYLAPSCGFHAHASMHIDFTLYVASHALLPISSNIAHESVGR